MARILLVEDDPVQLDMRRLILEHAGHEVECAATYEEAIAQCPGCQIAVLDLSPYAAQIAADLPPEMRVIVLSGRSPEPGLRADKILKKPCPTRQLLAAIASYGFSG